MGYESLINAISRQPGLEELADVLQKAVRAAFPGDGGREAKNLLHGTWLGHPLHPAITDVPLGAWTAALVLDAMESLSGRREFRESADAAVALGLVGAVGSAITGLTDWSETDDRGKRIGAVHGLLNVAAAAMYATSYAMRKKKSSRQSAVALSMLGYAIGMSSAYLGGHLVFGEQIGVDHTATADNTKPENFVRVLAEADLRDDTPTRVVAEGVAILLVKRAGRIFASPRPAPTSAARSPRESSSATRSSARGTTPSSRSRTAGSSTARRRSRRAASTCACGRARSRCARSVVFEKRRRLVRRGAGRGSRC